MGFYPFLGQVSDPHACARCLVLGCHRCVRAALRRVYLGPAGYDRTARASSRASDVDVAEGGEGDERRAGGRGDQPRARMRRSASAAEVEELEPPPARRLRVQRPPAQAFLGP